MYKTTEAEAAQSLLTWGMSNTVRLTLEREPVGSLSFYFQISQRHRRPAAGNCHHRSFSEEEEETTVTVKVHTGLGETGAETGVATRQGTPRQMAATRIEKTASRRKLSCGHIDC